MVEAARQKYSFEEYVRLEEMSPQVKHEFLAGHVWAMAGGSPDHAAVAANVATSLNNQLRGEPCRVFSSDLRIRVLATGLGTYPDVTVVCSKLELDPEDAKGHTVTNPTLVVEVLSPSTEEYDRGEKLDHYQQIDSLTAIVLVAYDARRLEVVHREGEGWHREVVEEGSAKLAGLPCELDLDDVFRDPLG